MMQGVVERDGGGEGIVITVADIIALPAFRQVRLAAPCPGHAARRVVNVGILDHGPDEAAYSDFLPGEFIVSNLGFAREDPALAEASLLAMLERNVSAVAVKTMYASVGPRVLAASSDVGVPVFVYEGDYHEVIAYQALDLIRRDKEQSDKGRLVDGLLSSRGPADVRAALYNVAHATGAALQCVAVRPSGADECSLYASLDGLSGIVSSFKQTWGSVETACALRHHDRLLAFASYARPPIDGQARSEAALVSAIEAMGLMHVGVSEEVPLSDGDLAIRQALAALDCAAGGPAATVRWRDLGERAFGAAASADRLFSRICVQQRRLIEAYDAENDAELLPTAEAFARAAGDARAASEMLYQHPNTVRYRLRKLKGVVGMPEATDRELARFLALVFLAP